MALNPMAVVGWVKSHVAKRDRQELYLLLGALTLVFAVLIVLTLAGEVLEGDTRHFDERILRALRQADDPGRPIGPRWLEMAANDITALGGPTVLGLTVAAVVGFLALQGLYRNAAFVFVASAGAWLLNNVLKQLFGRPRPDIVPHLREVMSLSFPSGHALTSAAVFLTLGALTMRVAERRLVKFYCMFVAMLASLLVGLTRVYLGVHHPTDVAAGWLIGLCWALLCWMVERGLERKAGLKKERVEASR